MLALFLQEGQLRPVQEMLLTGRSAQLQLIVGVKEARLIDRPPMHARRYVTGSWYGDATMGMGPIITVSNASTTHSLSSCSFNYLEDCWDGSLCGSSREPNSLIRQWWQWHLCVHHIHPTVCPEAIMCDHLNMTFPDAWRASKKLSFTTTPQADKKFVQALLAALIKWGPGDPMGSWWNRWTKMELGTENVHGRSSSDESG